MKLPPVAVGDDVVIAICYRYRWCRSLLHEVISVACAIGARWCRSSVVPVAVQRDVVATGQRAMAAEGDRPVTTTSSGIDVDVVRCCRWCRHHRLLLQVMAGDGVVVASCSRWHPRRQPQALLTAACTIVLYCIRRLLLHVPSLPRVSILRRLLLQAPTNIATQICAGCAADPHPLSTTMAASSSVADHGSVLDRRYSQLNASRPCLFH